MMMIQKCNPVLLSLLLCAPIFCADTPIDHHEIDRLMKATYQDFLTMNFTETAEAKKVLQLHLDQSKKAFLNEPLFLGMSRKTVRNHLDHFGFGLILGGGLQSATRLDEELSLEVASGMREENTCSAMTPHLAHLAPFCIGSSCGIMLIGLSSYLSMHPAESQLETVKRAEYAKIKAVIHEVMAKRR